LDFKSAFRKLAKQAFDIPAHLIGRLGGRYYFEDYIRVYPDGRRHLPLGISTRARPEDINNYKNHCKVYRFAAQFVRNARVVDVGCGSGYGCKILKTEGRAGSVSGCDLSRPAIRYAQHSFSEYAEFSEQSVTDMKQFSDSSFDVAISSEVLEHVKEYGMEGKTISEIKRIVRENGLLILGTPNSELMGSHGFYYDEIDMLMAHNFKEYCIFENALVPFEPKEVTKWEDRRKRNRTGVIVSELINLSETSLPNLPNVTPQLKRGVPATRYRFDGLDVDLSRLHNTHSWLILAINEKDKQ
jgi:2-polyprenyl-3-methyl-5-hydroxy-6-metoxy-1,4-benzoquinol methylase